MDTLENIEYDVMLANAIKMLSSFEHKSGGEGSAYFLNDKFVVKRYSSFIQNEEAFSENFDLYCKEMKRYGDAGFPVPKIYSWLKAPAPEGSRTKYYYYILEERINGRELFFDELEEFYSRMEDILSESEYFSAIKNPQNDPKVFKKIIECYVDDFISMNNFIANMSETELANFLFHAYEMQQNGKYSYPDFFPHNVMAGKDKLTLIDNSTVKRYKEFEEKDFLDSKFWDGILMLFAFNGNISDPENTFLYHYKDFIKDLDCLRSGKEKNLKECKEAVMRVVRLAKKYCNNPVLTDFDAHRAASITLNLIFPKEDAHEIMSEIIME